MQDIAIKDIKFWNEVSEEKGKTVKRLWVRYSIVGSKLVNNALVARMIKGQEDFYYKYIKPHQDAYEQGKTLEEAGTPLNLWENIGDAEINALTAVSCLTVERLAELPENLIVQVKHPNIRALKREAAAYLANRDEARKAQYDVARDAEIEEMKAQMAAMAQLLEAQTAPTGKAK